jgi:hypothetical protein
MKRRLFRSPIDRRVYGGSGSEANAGNHDGRSGPTRAIAIVLAAALVATVLVLTAGPASAVTGEALINGDTVVGSPSQEEQIATALGLTVTVVPDATWATYTAADFGQYELLIAGDPSCGTLPPGLVSTASVFGPVVLGLSGGRTLAGNRIVVGTDPVFHDGGDYTSPDARGTIIREGIAYAASNAGTTGMYFDSTCGADYYGQSAETLAILEGMSAGSGTWTIDADPPCGGAVSLIASNPSFTDLTTASLQGWSCSVHESFPTFPSDWSALAVATDTASTPTCGVDPDTGMNACGEAYILIAGSSIVVESKVISVSPLDSTNPVGTSHTVIANVHAEGGTPPVVGQLVTFTVTGQNAGATGSCVPIDCKSDVNGDVSFTYSDGAGTVGDDTIKASFLDDANSLQTATAQKHWVSVTPNPTSTTYTGDASVQYSDPTTLSGQLQEQGSGNPIPGKTLDFTLGTQNASAGPTDPSGKASTSLTVTQAPGSVASVGTSFAGDASFDPSNDSDPFEITREDCTLAYTGDTLVNAANMTNLKAQFGEPDASPGDWSGKLVTFTVTDASNVVQTFTATTDVSGLASVQAPLGPNVYGVSASFAGDGFYVPCQTVTDTLVTVQAANAKITGGGWIAQSTGNTNFGFNVIPDVTGLHGQLQIRSKAGKNRFHSATVLSLSTSGNTGTWTGTGRWNGTDGYTFTISVVDNGSSGKKGDTISIVIKSPSNVTVFTTSGAQPLKGGNITVH